VRELERRALAGRRTYATICPRFKIAATWRRRKTVSVHIEVLNGLPGQEFPESVTASFTPRWRNSSTRSRKASVDWVKLLRDFYGPFEKDLCARQSGDVATSSAKRSRPKRCARNAASPW